ncbi:MAG: DUF4352 domain-containing protein, partial [Candidatus Sumerlaeia bacterium]|nr:DUF4352 domain-containing protein [Candidatus Sumerlaeia bacterium]
GFCIWGNPSSFGHGPSPFPGGKGGLKTLLIQVSSFWGVALEHGLINSLGVKTPNPHMSAFLWRTMANSVSITLKQMVVEKDYDWVLKDFDEKRLEDISQQGLASVREAPVSDHLPEGTIVDSDPEVQDNNRDIRDTLPAGHFNERESIDIGYFSYMVLESSWPKKSDLNFGNRSLSDGQFLMIKLGIRNNDRKPRQIPPLTLVDDSGREYRQSSVGSLQEYSFGLLEVINPNVTKLGVLYFEVPSTPSFRLKVSGGYWSSDYSFIVLTPK